MRTIACNSTYGAGGVGQHFAQIVETARETGRLHRYYAPGIPPDDPLGETVTVPGWKKALVKYSPLRYAPAWKNYLLNNFFDRAMANTLTPPVDTFTGFVGKSLKSFREARSLGADRLELVAANSHVRNVHDLHCRAASDTGIDDTWLNRPQIRKTEKEYEEADVIFTHSEYTHQSFLDQGVDPDKLQRMHLHVSARFQPPNQRPTDDVFRVVYVGRLDATKGIPLLLDAYERLRMPSKQLTLVGGWSSRSMAQYMRRRLDELDGVTVAPGDPLPALHTADAFVHPTYEDGFGYAPTEALAAGVPTIVTEDTGMKEHVVNGQNGFIVPTGRVAPIVDRLHDLHRHPLATTHSLLPPQFDVPARPPKSMTAA